jgi:hypothetical protein
MRIVSDRVCLLREANTVSLLIGCADDYAAIEMYESLCEAARSGGIALALQTRPLPAAGDGDDTTAGGAS